MNKAFITVGLSFLIAFIFVFLLGGSIFVGRLLSEGLSLAAILMSFVGLAFVIFLIFCIFHIAERYFWKD